MSALERSWGAPQRDHLRAVASIECDQAAAILRDHSPRELTSTEIGKLYRAVLLHPCKGRCPGGIEQDDRRLDQWEHYGDGFDVWVNSRLGSNMLDILHRLERRDLVASRKEGRRLFWRWTGDGVDLSAFEDALAEGSAS